MATLHTLKLTDDEVDRVLRLLSLDEIANAQLIGAVSAQAHRPLSVVVRQQLARLARRAADRATQER